MNTKLCSRCKQTKDSDQFPKDKTRPDGLFSWCKQCKKEAKQKDKDHVKEYNKKYKDEHKDEISDYRKQYYQEHQEDEREYQKQYYNEHHEQQLKLMENYRRKCGMKPMSENKDCSLFLGTHVTERAIKPILPNAERMPHGHPKYDYLCSQGYKVDVKSATTSIHKVKNTLQWKFKINKNIEADYFMCVAYNNRDDLNIIKMWMIPGRKINHLGQLSISPGSFEKWSEYELDPKDATVCVEKIKNS